MARQAAHPPDPIADRAHDLGQVLGPDEDERKDRDYDEFGRINAEHAGSLALARLFISQRRGYRGLFAASSDVDRLLLAWQARRVGSALLLIAVALLLLVIGHAFLEALHALGDVLHHVRESISAEQQKQEKAKND